VLCDCDARREAANARWKREGQQKKVADLTDLYAAVIGPHAVVPAATWLHLKRLANEVNTRTPFASSTTLGIEAMALAQLALQAFASA
jgi:hypothetical protein